MNHFLRMGSKKDLLPYEEYVKGYIEKYVYVTVSGAGFRFTETQLNKTFYIRQFVEYISLIFGEDVFYIFKKWFKKLDVKYNGKKYKAAKLYKDWSHDIDELKVCDINLRDDEYRY